MLLREEIERSIGTEPDHRPIDELVATGHRRLRRRRVLTATAALAMVAAVGTTYAATQAGEPVGDGPQVATEPTPSDPADEDSLDAGVPAALGADGLRLAPGAEVIRRVENPLGLEPPGTSLGLVVEYRGRTTWLLLDWQRNGGGALYDEAGRTFPTFDLWLEDAVAMQNGEPTLALVEFRPDGSLRPAEDGVRVLDQQQDPAMPDSFAGPNATTAVAHVTWRGESWFVLARQLPGSDPEYFPTAGSIVGDPETIAAFLDVARDRYTDGDGLR
jgi:hypothetical protein